MMEKKADDLKSIVLKFIQELEEQRNDVQLPELQKVLFLLQKLLKKDFVQYSIFNYGPYSIELEHVVDELLFERELNRYGSKFCLAGAAPNTTYDETIHKVAKALNQMPSSQVQKACTVMYFTDKSASETEAFAKALSVTPSSNMEDFKSAYGQLSDELRALAV